ncbi:NYN domain-containing protein [Thauera sp. WH-1]|uniref:NYN domain-containing protein n=1 Tax=Thauera sp. WH-1 TaxID=3398230 RepID=UPI0039FDC414
MASSPDSISMALFCDFENVALGVRDANYEKFDIKRVLERLLLKGSIVVKKAYCDWDRYKSFKAAMHEANFELIEIPHVRQSGKNSADIRLVVDALDLCYTKSHVDTFVIISGDSDFSPLVSKLRENAKQVIGVGVKQSTSDLLIANCDEFIFYDDLVRDSQRAAAKRDARDSAPAPRRSPEEEKRRKEESEARRRQAIDIAVETFEALLAERGESGKIWASMLKEAIKRRKPDFNESYFGFRAFGNLLEEAQTRGLLELGRDEKSGTYVSRPSATVERAAAEHEAALAHAEPPAVSDEVVVEPVTAEVAAPEERGGRGDRGAARASRRRGSGRGAAESTSREQEATQAAADELGTGGAGATEAASVAAAAAPAAPASAVPTSGRPASKPPAAAAETLPAAAAAMAASPAEAGKAGHAADRVEPASPEAAVASAPARKPARRTRAPAESAPAASEARAKGGARRKAGGKAEKDAAAAAGASTVPVRAGEVAPLASAPSPAAPLPASSAGGTAAGSTAEGAEADAPPVKKPASRSRRSHKPKAEAGG